MHCKPWVQDRPRDSHLPAELRGADDAHFAAVLGESIDAIDAAGIPHALIGGIASSGFGRPRWTHDIDVMVRPEDAERALDVLARQGFDTEKTDQRWLFKAFKHRVMVDIIFRSGNMYLDGEMMERLVQGVFQARRVRFVPPEDLLIMKAMIADETGAHHWHDALGLIATGSLDWDYLERRALRAPRRTLSLLVYAQSMDLTVPNHAIRTLYQHVYES
jgi:hypothetical protein